MMSTVDGNEHLDNSDTDTRMENDLTSSISSEIDIPGAVPTLTSSGRVSPHRIRPLRDQETQLQELKKENFGLKLRIYHLEDKLRKRHGELNEDWEMNIQLNVQVDEMKQEMANREDLLRDAKNAIDALEKKIQVLEEQLQASQQPSEELLFLQDALRKAKLEIEENRLKAVEAEKAALAESQRALALEEENRNLAQRLAEMSSKPMVDQRNREVQTEEDVGQKLKVLADELEEQKLENKRLKESCDTKDKKIQELELELLKISNKMAAMATDHAQQKQALNDEIMELKTYLQQKDEQLRAKDIEITELNRQFRELQRQLRDASDTIEQLKIKLTNKEEECSEKDREIEDLRRRLHDLQREVDRLNNVIKGLEKTVRDRDDEIEDLKRQLRQRGKEISDLKDEIALLKKELAEKDSELTAARTAAHSNNMDSQEKSNQVTKMLTEIRELRETVKEEVQLKNEALSSAESKDEMISRLKKDKDDLHRRLIEAEERILQMTAAHATEKGILQTTIEDLRRQLEQKEEILQLLKEEVAQLRGENEALKREVEMLRAENTDLSSSIQDLEHQIGEKDLLLDQAEHTIASLQKALEELSLNQGKDTGVPSSEMARLRALLEAQEQVLRTKESEILSIRQALHTKDKIITDLQAELHKACQDKETLEEALLVLHAEREQLETRIKELEDSLASSDDSYSQARRAVESLQEQVRRLEEQLKQLSRSPHKVSVSVESTPKKEEASPGSSSTTMIIGGMSESLLLTILQRIEELYREVISGRVEGSSSNTNLSGKMDDLTRLQKHVRSLLRQGQEGPIELHEALLREIEQLRAELESYKEQEREGVDVAGSLSVTLDELQGENEQLIHELELEKERSRREGLHTEQKATLFEQELKAARKKILALEKQLLEMNSLQRDLDRSRNECASLRGRLGVAEDHSRKLRTEITELRLANMHQSDDMVASSLPDLHNNMKPDENQWAATASSFTLGGDQPDLSELIERHKEVTRLNQELQRKCQEKLLVSPSSSRKQGTSSGNNSSFWQARLKQQEQALRNEMADNERHLQVRLQQLERQLRDNEQRREVLKNQLAESLEMTSTKEHEFISARNSLHNYKDKVKRLEEKLAQILAEKNTKIKELEEHISELLQTKLMYTPAADGELKTLRRSNVTLREEKAILTERLTNCQEQVLVLNKELEVYQQLLEDHRRDQHSLDLSVGGDSSDRVQKLLEEIKALRRQLECSIRNSTTLSDQLTHKLTSNQQSFDSATTTPPLDISDPLPTLPTQPTGTNLSLNETYTSVTGATPFVPHATSTTSKGFASHSKISTEIHSMGMNLEDKILQLLNSSSEGIDRGFLQELLLYLRQQRRQLNDSQRLFDKLEQSQQDRLPTVSHISVRTQLGGGAMGGDDDDGEEDCRASSRASSVDLSLIHEQLRRTQEALLNSKSLLKRKSKSIKTTSSS